MSGDSASPRDSRQVSERTDRLSGWSCPRGDEGTDQLRRWPGAAQMALCREHWTCSVCRADGPGRSQGWRPRRWGRGDSCCGREPHTLHVMSDLNF